MHNVDVLSDTKGPQRSAIGTFKLCETNMSGGVAFLSDPRTHLSDTDGIRGRGRTFAVLHPIADGI